MAETNMQSRQASALEGSGGSNRVSPGVAGLEPATAMPVLRVLIVEDSEIDARVLLHHLRQGGYKLQSRRVASGEAMLEALRSEAWDAILCDHSMPGFSAPEALKLLQGTGLDIPFLIVSAGIGEDVAVAAMKSGAHDFLIKGNLARLLPAVEREIRESSMRAARRAAESTLKESELRLRLVWENSLDAILLLDDAGVIQFANPAVKTLFGWNPEELCEVPLARLQAESSADANWWELARARGQGRIIDTPGLRKDGTCIDLDIAYSSLSLHERRMIAVFARDITERKRHLMEIHRSREEFAAAREIQQRLFPHRAPLAAGLDLAGASFPADAAGGDYFDYLELPDGSLGVVVADVSGHGIGPALLMAEARSSLRFLARASTDPAEILTHANRDMASDLGGVQYITLFLARVDPATRSVDYANAGHPAALWIGADGRVKGELRRTGPPLGQRATFHYAKGGSFLMELGDTLVLLTDGITESMRGRELFGRERVLDVVRANPAATAAELVQLLCDAARSFCAPAGPADDRTVLVVRAVIR